MKISVDGKHELYLERHGSGSEALIVLHGGPGVSCRSLQPLASLANEDRTVILYDQLGGGRSDRPEDDSLWTVKRFVEELEGVREASGFERVTLLGHSWGGCLALQYALDYPDRINGLILSSTASSIPLAFSEMSRLRLELGPKRFRTMIDCEANNTLDTPEYREAVNELYRRHVIRNHPDREEMLRAGVTSELGPSYLGMWGPHEFLCTGAVKDWDVTDRLGEIEVPALVISGLYDESTIETNKPMVAGLKDSNWVIIGNGSHRLLSERGSEHYLALVGSFLDRVASSANAALPSEVH
jgi:proline iminopeptidase